MYDRPCDPVSHNDQYENDEVKERLLYEGGDNTEEKQEEPKPIRPRTSYEFMDGLRGIGAFSVYLQHFMGNFYPL
jgi:hypothetical protein